MRVETTATTHDKLATAMATQTDALLAAAITKVLGHSDWKPEDLRGRLTAAKHSGTGNETWCLDAKPLMVFGPVKLEPFKVGSYTLTAYREVETLV